MLGLINDTIYTADEVIFFVFKRTFHSQVFRMSEDNRNIRFFQNIEYGDPALACRFHTNFRTIVLRKPITQFLQSFGKRRETSLLVFRSAVRICDTDTGIDPCFVDIKSTAVETKDFESQ